MVLGLVKSMPVHKTTLCEGFGSVPKSKERILFINPLIGTKYAYRQNLTEGL